MKQNNVILFLLLLISSCTSNEKKELQRRVQLIKPGYKFEKAIEIMGKAPDTIYHVINLEKIVLDYGTPTFGSSSQIAVYLSADSVVEYVTWGL